jgi:hypothetical protein
MFDLIKKNFMIGWLFLIGIVLLIPFLSSIAIWAMLDDFGGLIVGVFTLLTIGICIGSAFLFIGIDNAQNAEKIFVSLPIERSTIIISHYISSFLMIIFSLSIVIFSCLSSIHIFDKTDPAFDILLSTRGIIGMIVFLLFILCSMFPFIFKFGSGKGMMVALFTQLGIMLFWPILKFLFKAISGVFSFDLDFFNRLFHSTITWLLSLSATKAYSLLFFTVVFVISLSISLSILFYKKRDF